MPPVRFCKHWLGKTLPCSCLKAENNCSRNAALMSHHLCWGRGWGASLVMKLLCYPDKLDGWDLIFDLSSAQTLFVEVSPGTRTTMF